MNDYVKEKIQEAIMFQVISNNALLPDDEHANAIDDYDNRVIAIKQIINYLLEEMN